MMTTMSRAELSWVVISLSNFLISTLRKMPGIRTTLQLSSAPHPIDRSVDSCTETKERVNSDGKEYTNPRWFELKSGASQLSVPGVKPTERLVGLACSGAIFPHFHLCSYFNYSIIFRPQAVPRRLGISVLHSVYTFFSPFPLLDEHAWASRLRDSLDFKSKDNILHRYRFFLLESIKHTTGMNQAGFASLFMASCLTNKEKENGAGNRSCYFNTSLLFSSSNLLPGINSSSIPVPDTGPRAHRLNKKPDWTELNWTGHFLLLINTPNLTR